MVGSVGKRKKKHHALRYRRLAFDGRGQAAQEPVFFPRGQDEGPREADVQRQRRAQVAGQEAVQQQLPATWGIVGSSGQLRTQLLEEGAEFGALVLCWEPWCWVSTAAALLFAVLYTAWISRYIHLHSMYMWLGQLPAM